MCIALITQATTDFEFGNGLNAEPCADRATYFHVYVYWLRSVSENRKWCRYRNSALRFTLCSSPA
jgi:hypothetical protein